jgi:rod shape-determining protein MreD
MLIAWRLLRSDVWPAWWAAPLGFANDLLTGGPIGLSVSIWTAAMLLLDLSDRRTMWRDYWVEWALAVALIAAGELAHWRIAALMGAPSELGSIGPRVIITALCFPLAAWVVARLDRWRLGQ